VARTSSTAIDTSGYTNKELGAALNRLRATTAKYKDKAKATAEEFMGLALSTGAAFGIGWWMGQIQTAADFTEEDLQWWGIDKELIVGLGLVFAGISGFLGKQMGPAAGAMGKGVLAYWAGAQGEAIGKTPG
jgi:hypothetical protein